MSTINLKQILSVALSVPLDHPQDPNCRWGLSTILWGKPGISKSAQIRGAATQLGLPIKVVYAATSQPEDVSGAPFPDGQGGVAIHPILPGVQALMKSETRKGVLFIDELSCARPAVQAGFLGVMLDRTLGGQVLPEGVRILAAANAASDAAGGWDLEPPMANRLCHFEVTAPSVAEWSNWLRDVEEQMPDLTGDKGYEGLVKANWDREWPVVTGLHIAFLSARPALIHNLPPENNPARGRAWPSHRTWEFAARAMATCRCVGASEVLTEKFVEGCVGMEAATELFVFARKLDLPSPEDMLRNGFRPNPKRLDQSHAAYLALTSYVLNLPEAERPKVRDKVWDLLWALIDQGKGADIALPLIKELSKNGFAKQASAVANKCLTYLSHAVGAFAQKV